MCAGTVVGAVTDVPTTVQPAARDPWHRVNRKQRYMWACGLAGAWGGFGDSVRIARRTSRKRMRLCAVWMGSHSRAPALARLTVGDSGALFVRHAQG